ncbi:MAG: MptD family putative ECF transporter S component [Actinomycetaceae bacterium]|nr:MptD family putative ECF transporter S component [Actinomycetaceae bacterium]MDU0971121.1 MptD family putative ECF transporter S component [Actinomycetaceae bacterium]
MKINLTTRDLINIAIFAVIYFVLFYACGMLGFVGPAFMFVGWIIGIILNGIVVMLMLARVPKIGAMTLTGLLMGIGMIPGHTIWVLPAGIILGFIADLIATNMGRNTRLEPKRGIIAYAVYQLIMMVPWFPIVFNSDEYYAKLTKVMGADYVSGMKSLFTPTTMAIWAVCVVLLGLAGGWLGVKVGRKHFQRAGLTK